MRKESGFTLVELMVAITIVAILVAIAVPTWGKWIPGYRLKQATRDVYSSFQKAKMEAVRRNVNVVLSFNTVTNTYKMFADDGSGAGTAKDFVQNGSEPILGNYTIPDSVTLDSTTFTGNAAGFTSRGLPAKPSAGLGNGSVKLSNTKGISRQIRLSMAGNIRIHRP